MKRATRNLLIATRIALGVALLYYVLVTRGEWQAARDFVSTVWLFPMLVGLAVFGAAIESLRLSILYGSQKLHLPFWAGYRLVTIATFFNLCIPGGTGGDVVKLYYLAGRYRGKGIEAAMVLLVDRAVGLFTLLLVGVSLAPFNMDLIREHRVMQVLVLVACGLMLLLIGMAVSACSKSIAGRPWFDKIVARLPLSRHIQRALEALRAFSDHKTTLVAAAAVSLIGHAALAATFVAAAKVLMPEAPGIVVAFLGLLGILANAIPLTPGGLGVGEAAFEALFGMVGYSGGAQILLAWRAGIVPLLIAGGVLYVVQGRRQPHLPQESRSEAAPEGGESVSGPAGTRA